MANVKVVVETIDKGSANVQKAERDLKGMLETVGKLSAGVVAAGMVFKKAFEFGTEGANLNQLQQSFEYLNDSILKTPNLLNDLRAASRGTVDDTTLMEGVLKLTAGTSEELGQSLAMSAPRLMEIAKAAQKLNPSLGDTAFLYESISTGIKRQSPLILDNLGIVVKVGEANEKYAASIGKTVAELTAEEKQMALLNATMEAGGRLIEQVGGDVSSQADAWAQLTAQINNTTGAAKQYLAEGLTPVMQAVSGQYGDTVDGMIEANLATAKSMSDLIEEGQKLSNVAGMWGGLASAVTGTEDEIRAGIQSTVAAMAEQSLSFEEFSAALDSAFSGRAKQAVQQHIRDMGLTAEQYYTNIHAGAELVATYESFDRALTRTNPVIEQFNEILSETDQRMRMNALIANDYREASLEYEVTAEMVKEAEDARAQAHEDAAKEMEAAAEAAQKARQAQADFFNSLVGNNDAMAEWNSIMGETSTVSYKVAGRTSEQESALADLRNEYARAQEAITSYQIGVKGVGLSEEERNQKIQEQLDYMAQLDAQMQPLVAIQNEYATATQGGTVNTDLLNQKLFEQIQASTDDASAIALAGVALGQFTEEQGNAMLKAALLEEFIRAQAVAFGEGKTTIEGAQEAISNFITSLENIPSVVQTEVRTNYTQTGTPVSHNPAPISQGGTTPEFRASGGPVMAGQSYIVGEAGRELFVPQTNGMIVPNDKMPGAASVTVNVYGAMGANPAAIAGAVSKALTPRG